jgi:iduronate 2-sulfatase
MPARPRFLWLALTLLAMLPTLRTHAAEQKFNILFIAVDDLRPALGCYGDPLAHTPNLDALAASGMIFQRAYCQQAVCSPSRTSLLTGRRPDTTRVFDLQTHFRDTIPDVITLPQHFKNHGWFTQSFSKVYHGSLNDPVSWSVPWTPRAGPDYLKPESLDAIKKRREARRAGAAGTDDEKLKGPPWEDPDCADDALPDGITAAKAIDALRQIKDKPFFLAVGFSKPHLPFVAPRRWFDLHPMEKFKLPANYAPPKDAPPIAFTDWGELRAYLGMPAKGALKDEDALNLIRAYYAASSYSDSQIGKVLDELDHLGLRDKTIVIVWGDHGWHLGDLGQWCKHTNFEVATRAPLIISVPGQKNAGGKCNALVEFVDIYPSLCGLASLDKPEGLEGTSFVPLLEEPTRPWKTAAFSQYPRRGNVMGYSMRTDRFRYTEWLQEKKCIASELYDHQQDPGETENISHQSPLSKSLSDQLHRGWRAALPE